MGLLTVDVPSGNHEVRLFVGPPLCAKWES